MTRLDRLEPRVISALKDGDARRWSRLTELVAWAVWQIVLSIPFADRGRDGGRHFLTWLRKNQPPGFIPPTESNG